MVWLGFEPFEERGGKNVNSQHAVMAQGPTAEDTVHVNTKRKERRNYGALRCRESDLPYKAVPGALGSGSTKSSSGDKLCLLFRVSDSMETIGGLLVFSFKVR